MKLAHISITARDADRLAAFYVAAFNCTPSRAPVTLTGARIVAGCSLPQASIRSLWLRFPGVEYPFLELHQHRQTLERGLPQVNEPGYGHLCFQTPDIHDAVRRTLRFGGALQGEITDIGAPDHPCLAVYLRDPEGNLLELEEA
ncbi:VOC family protein [Ruegeria aquimaris]|uniref:VOC family protein n=1 Tax=Ruegeria aquimaris TaxID=2984333 RepID=A0ABT3ALL1_9RHOB|nr:VOC family protein [Ruegeria sp. XHP0148]MCV2889177.1 VOC family protein [Ruegeria sp. XHP0148]